MIHMLKHKNHLKHNNTNLIKDTITDMGTKRSMAACLHHLPAYIILVLFG